MALVKCPECSKEVSSTANICPNCSFIIKKKRRGITGTIFNVLFILFNAFMILWIASIFMLSSPENVDMTVAKTIGTGMLVFIWIVIGLPLGIMNYITRPKAYD